MRKAFTLIELLVTIVLFSLLLATSLYSFRFISLNIRNINNTNPQEAIYYELLRNVIGSIYYYVEKDEKNDGSEDFYHFFKGTSSECFFISKSALFNKRLVMIHLKYDNGLFIYEEGEIFKKNINYLDLENIPFTIKKVIKKNLKRVDFSYIEKEKEKEKIYRYIPDVIKIRLEDNRNISEYFFRIKSDNYSYLKNVKFGKEIF